MRITVKLASSGRDDADVRAEIVLQREARDLGLEMQRAHPGVADPVLASYFVAEAGPDRPTAEKAAAHLFALDVVEAAYVAPEAELTNESQGRSQTT